MNLTKNELLILEQLRAAGDSELYGLDMVKASGGKLNLGFLYVILSNLEEKGLIQSRLENNSNSIVLRRLYKITSSGIWKYDLNRTSK